MRIDFARLSLPFVRPARILLVPQRFFLFRVHREGRLATTLLSQHSSVDMLKLRITIGMLIALAFLAIRLKTVTQIHQQTTHGGSTHLIALSAKFRCESSRTLARPAQRVHRIALVVGLISASSASINSGCWSWRRFRPPPLLRC